MGIIKKKKMIQNKKNKQTTSAPLIKQMSLLAKTGMYLSGCSNSIDKSKEGLCKMVIMKEHCTHVSKVSIQYYLSICGNHLFEIDSTYENLDYLLGLKFKTNFICVTNFGLSEISELYYSYLIIYTKTN